MGKAFTENQIAAIKMAVRIGCWNNLYQHMGSGVQKEAYGYYTGNVKVDGLTDNQVVDLFSEIKNVISEKKFDFMAYISDFWGDGNGMLFISSDVDEEVSAWALSSL